MTTESTTSLLSPPPSPNRYTTAEPVSWRCKGTRLDGTPCKRFHAVADEERGRDYACPTCGVVVRVMER